MLTREGLARDPFHPAGLINAAALAGLESPVTISSGTVFAGDQRKQAASVAAAARKIVTSNGAASVSAIGDSLSDSVLDSNAIRGLLTTSAEARWLDPECEWLFLPTTRNRAENFLRKMLSVTPSLSAAEVREGFRRYDGREVILPRQIVLELSNCFGWTRVEGEQISTAVSLDYREVLENTEETLVEIFLEYGPVLDRATVLEHGAERGLDRMTAGLYLGWSPVIDRIATNRYTLRGLDVPAGTLEAMRGSGAKSRVQRGHGLDEQRAPLGGLRPVVAGHD